MKLSKFGIVAVLFASAVGLSACTAKNDASGSGKDTVNMWVHYSKEDPEGKAMKQNINAFNKENKQGYTAKVQYIPRSGSGGGYEDKINAALNSNTLPDVLTLDGPNTAAYANSKIIQPVGKYIKNKDDILQSIRDQGTFNNKLYAIGYSESGVGIYYNKKMFSAAGIQESELPTLEKPWTWDEFMDISKRLKQKYNAPAIDMQLSDHSEMSIYSLAPFMWSAGGNVTNSKGTKAVGYFNSDETNSAFQFIQNMVKNGYTTISPKQKGFQTGKYAMMLSGSWTIQELDNQYKDIDYGILPYPVSPKTKKLVSPTGSWQYAMSSSTKAPKAAGALINFLVAKKQMYRTDMSNTVLPARKSVSELMKKKVNAPMQFLIDQNQKSGHARPVLVNYPQVSRTFAETVTKATYYKENPDIAKLMKKQAQDIQQYLK
ncbi:multiple sugar abc transporter substrate-binding protein [Lapidilactobacillus concavus DSM 17758]|uniref:Multiple sugar abc transporter substrate-binding protein n=1 Tax=Lapidilactobacillus concavus DSM 17758 TaxID=1423735 RepID=A0A0R1VXY2_9LACO|nr:sugar ABC transporter substrate-binding protein [Lapidilactobacillus concavus]KRM10407.1 multiple sugar abc transporter substrate-binding protein [Lapidilactobacillus concavus DSM 17758]GEL12825.1 sugar ABC transporter substrate-binding protein [Lapidilactobacillus concavus]